MTPVIVSAMLGALAMAPGVQSSSVSLILSEDCREVIALSSPDEPMRNLLAASRALYAIDLVKTDGTRFSVTAREAAQTSFEQVGQTLRLQFGANEVHPATVICSFAPSPDGALLGHIEVTPAEGLAVAGVTFPILEVAVPLEGDGEDDQLVLPMYDGAVVRNPAVALKSGNSWVGGYPGNLVAQFLALTSNEGGVYLACYDSGGHTKRMQFQRTERGLSLSATYLPPLEFGASLAVAYPIAIRCCRGSWMDAANLYKAWAVNQPWCRRRLSQRSDIPAWLLRGPFFHAVSLRNQKQDKTWVNLLPELPAYIRRYHEALDWPVCAMIMAWEKHGAWITPDYFPPFGGDEAFRQATSAILEQGDSTLVFLSGLKWTLEKDTPNFSGREAFERVARGDAVVGADGQVQEWGKPDQDVGQHAQICPVTPTARKILIESTLQCLDLGVLGVQVDQIVSGAMPPCYATHHGHPQGYGLWLSRGVYDLFAATVNAGKKRNPDYVFAIEEPHELFIPLLDCYHARDYQFGRWPRSGPGRPYPIPLFAYLYHEYCLGYGGDSASLSPNASPYLALAQAMNALTGKTPGGCVWTRALDPAEVHPTILGFTKQHCNLLRAGAGKWIVLGKMADWDFVSGPTVTIRAGESDFVFHAVQSSAWLAEDGSLAWLLANIGEDERGLSLALKRYDGAFAGPVRLAVIRGDTGNEEEIGRGVNLPTTVTVTLPPGCLSIVVATPQ